MEVEQRYCRCAPSSGAGANMEKVVISETLFDLNKSHGVLIVSHHE